jgi:8-oxo-dGTP pyrophosphatase MutT (NUDIX family)
MSDMAGRTVRCRTIGCTYVEVPAAQMTFRIGAYGLVGSGERLLLVKFPHLGQYTLPGGGVDPHETLEEAVRRECLEEAGIAVSVGRMIYSAQENFIYPHTGRPHNCLSHFFLCAPERGGKPAASPSEPDFGGAVAEWLDARSLGDVPLHPFIREPVRYYVERLLRRPVLVIRSRHRANARLRGSR